MPHDRLAALARFTLALEGVGDDAELTVHFVAPEVIAEMNESFLGHSGPTDVLSFSIEDDWRAHRGPDPLLLGDVVICPEVAFANAPVHAGTYEDELALLVVHGVLHVLGRDHEIDAEAEEMEAREAEILAAFVTSR